MLKPVAKQNLSNQVFNQLRDNILNEEYLPGDRLPSERELCGILHINRSSVREALKRLEEARLIEIRHGEGSVVLDFRIHAGFDLLRHMVNPSGQPNFITVRSLCEIRAVMCTEIARLAARRIQPAELEEIEALIRQMEGCASADPARFQDLDFDFHYTLAKASENVAFVLMLNSIREVYLPMTGAFQAMFGHVLQDPSIYRRIASALEARDAVKAAELTSQLIQEGNALFLSLFNEEDEARP